MLFFDGALGSSIALSPEERANKEVQFAKRLARSFAYFNTFEDLSKNYGSVNLSEPFQNLLNAINTLSENGFNLSVENQASAQEASKTISSLFITEASSIIPAEIEAGNAPVYNGLGLLDGTFGSSVVADDDANNDQVKFGGEGVKELTEGTG